MFRKETLSLSQNNFSKRETYTFNKTLQSEEFLHQEKKIGENYTFFKKAPKTSCKKQFYRENYAFKK